MTLGTAVYSASQGLLAALAGAKYVAPTSTALMRRAAMAFVWFRSCKRYWSITRPTAWY